MDDRTTPESQGKTSALHEARRSVEWLPVLCPLKACAWHAEIHTPGWHSVEKRAASYENEYYDAVTKTAKERNPVTGLVRFRFLFLIGSVDWFC